MVGLPNRAGRCTICKHRKVKCDLSRPACSRCKRLSLSCEYLAPQQGQVFINRSVTNPFVKAVDIFSNVNKSTSEKSDARLVALSRVRQNVGAEHLIPKHPDGDSSCMMALLCRFIDVYLPEAAHGPKTIRQTLASWVCILPDIAITNSAYTTSLKALCLVQIGIWNHDHILKKESFRVYGAALGELRRTIRSIGSQKLLAPEATLASIVILSTYEQFLDPSEQNSGWMHARGGSHILQLLGSSFCETPVGRLLFAKIRTIGIAEAFRTRRASILDGLEGQCCINEPEGHDLLCHLQDLMIQLPSIMEALDLLDAGTNETADTSVLIQLLQLCSGLDVELLAWNEKLKNQVQGQLYWTVPSVANNPSDDLVLGRVFPLSFQFPCLRVAQLLLLYWSMLILLYRTIQHIQERLKSQISHRTETGHCFALQGGWNEVYSGNSCISSTIIAPLASNISQSVEYCYRTENGTHGTQLTIFPLWVARRFYESQSDRSRELAWYSELSNTTAPDSRFDLYKLPY